MSQPSLKTTICQTGYVSPVSNLGSESGKHDITISPLKVAQLVGFVCALHTKREVLGNRAFAEAFRVLPPESKAKRLA